MKKANRVYQKSDCDFLYGQIEGSDYVVEVQQILKKQRVKLSDSYVRLVVNQFSYNEKVWDAVKQVIRDRNERREKLQQELKQLAPTEAV